MQENNWKVIYHTHCQSKGYEFTNEWFPYNIPIWQEVFKQLINLPNLNFLEIGSWEGQSTCWLLDNILTHSTSKITCIDTFAGGIEHQGTEELSTIEKRFDNNIIKSGNLDKVIKIVGFSQTSLRNLPFNSYDFIYIDGSHIASDVLEDTILSWRLLKERGIIIFDDYRWEAYKDQPLKHPAPAIDSFLSIFQDKINIIYQGYQVIIQKKHLEEENNKVNLIFYPDWTRNELEIGEQLSEVISTILNHKNRDRFNLFIMYDNILKDDLNIFISGILLNLYILNDGLSDCNINLSLVSKTEVDTDNEFLKEIDYQIILDNQLEESINSVLHISQLTIQELTNFISPESENNYMGKIIPINNNSTEANQYVIIAMQEFNNRNFLKSVAMYKNAIAENPGLINIGGGVSLSHAMILATDWQEISTHLSPSVNYLESSGWLNSLWQNKPVNKDNQPIPFYTYPAIEFLEDKIDKNWRIFEYGSGHSTIWWANRVSQVISLENVEDWYSYIQTNIPDNVTIHLEKEERKYAEKINEYDDHYFDLIIIDGVNRNECIKFSLSKIKDVGCIIFDNTDDNQFNQGINLLLDSGYHKIDFYGLSPGYTYKNCTSIFFKDFTIFANKNLPSKKQSCF